jgi:hypothetical protein
MKRILLFVLFAFAVQSASAQDYIVKINGEEIFARVLEITLQEVIYQQPADSLKEITERIPRSEVFMVRFANGTREVFGENLPEAQVTEVLRTSDEMYMLGKQDALKYYKGTGAMWGSAASSLIWPYGYAGSLAIGLTRPKAQNHPVSDYNLLTDPHYVRGYEDQAKKKKGRKALAGAGIGTVAIFGTVLYILSTVGHM